MQNQRHSHNPKQPPWKLPRQRVPLGQGRRMWIKARRKSNYRLALSLWWSEVWNLRGHTWRIRWLEWWSSASWKLNLFCPDETGERYASADPNAWEKDPTLLPRHHQKMQELFWSPPEKKLQRRKGPMDKVRWAVHHQLPRDTEGVLRQMGKHDWCRQDGQAWARKS